jgi:hypothetical protein
LQDWLIQVAGYWLLVTGYWLVAALNNTILSDISSMKIQPSGSRSLKQQATSN